MPAPRLALSLSTGLRLSPQVQKALHLLQVPAAELGAVLREEVLSNPCLELEDDTELEVPFSLQRSWERPAAGMPVGPDGASWERELPEPDPGVEARLRRQIGCLRDLDEEVRRAALFWTGCLDERGFAAVPDSEVALGAAVDVPTARAGRQLVQSLDPAGIGARNVRECFLEQLERNGDGDSLLAGIVRDGWDLLLAGRIRHLAGELGIEESEIRRAIGELRKLSPSPGFSPASIPHPVWPELRVEEGPASTGRPWVVRLEESHLPKLRLVPPPKEVREAAEAEAFLQERGRSAQGLIQAMERRQQTLLRVGREIVGLQGNFFRNGPDGLVPMTLRDIAGPTGLHESTVARVTQAKYIDTPRGIFPLRYFFSGRVHRRGSAAAASRAVQQRIRDLIAAESAVKPLSDTEIAAELRSEGIRIARRTVAKYRDGMRIPRARLRRLSSHRLGGGGGAVDATSAALLS